MISRTIYEFCCENVSKIENFEKAMNDKEMWHCHHRLETHDENGNEREYSISVKTLKEQGLYFNRPANELIFLRMSEHRSLHNRIQASSHSAYLKKYYEDHPELRKQKSEKMKELAKNPEYLKKISDGVKRHHKEHPETREKISQARKGRKYTEAECKAHKASWEARKGTHLSEEAKKKISKGNKGKIRDEECKKKLSEACKKVVHTQEWINKAAEAKRGMTYDKTNFPWWTNGKENYRGPVCPDGYWKGVTRSKKSGSVGFHWYNNGIISTLAKECPEGFVPGRIV